MAVAAAVLSFALTAPHLLAPARLAPRTAIRLWISVLALRAAVALALVSIVVLYLPATELFALLTHWCLHAVIPFVATHLGFNGHEIGDAATLVPALVIAASVLSAGVGVWRGARAARRWLRHSAVGPGPGESLIVGGSDVVVAAAGLRTPRVIVSAGALVQLDDAELSAGLEHEWGHVTQRHRFIAVAGQLLAGLSRLLPGGRRARRQLLFALERDADDYAIRKTGDRLALASAICKAAGVPAGTPATSLGGTGAAERVRLLVAGATATSRSATWIANGLALAAVAMTLALAGSAPALASGATGSQAMVGPLRGCE